MKLKRMVNCGGVEIGGDSQISIQSMLNTDTRDVDSSIAQMGRLVDAGCHIVRLAVPDMEAAEAFGKIRKKSKIPMVADIHFDYRLAIRAIEMGADKIRLNPGNIGSHLKVREVVERAKDRGIPIRIGVNGGSLEKDVLEKHGRICGEALVESAMNHVNILRDEKFEDIVISIKTSNPKVNYEGYILLDEITDYPLHIGVTEAGTIEGGIVKSAVGIGGLLLAGVGNTMRVSLTGDPVEEVLVGKKILAAAGLREEMINIVSCPTCGRTGVDLDRIAREVEMEMKAIGEHREKEGKTPITIAVMGCEVNGPGEAKDADLGVACTKTGGAIFMKGEKIKFVEEGEIIEQIVNMARELD